MGFIKAIWTIIWVGLGLLFFLIVTGGIPEFLWFVLQFIGAVFIGTFIGMLPLALIKLFLGNKEQKRIAEEEAMLEEEAALKAERKAAKKAAKKAKKAAEAAEADESLGLKE